MHTNFPFPFQNYLITSPKVKDMLVLVKQAVAAGYRFVQLRDKHAADQDMEDLGRSLLPYLRAHQVELIINDRLSVAQSLGVGLHVGMDDVDPRIARQCLGAAAWIGLTIHDQLGLAEQYQDCVNYVGVGPIFPTQTKKDSKRLLGTKLLQDICRNSSVPVVAVGGIDLSNAHQVVAAGPAGMAVCSAVCLAADPYQSAYQLCQLWD